LTSLLDNPGEKHQFRRRLLNWYDANRRDLPWRKDRNPYHIWLSEIMLQQTRVAAVLEHYRRFLRRFPTVQRLASARESSVLAAWSGLGYYRRARMMHAAAKVIVKEHAGGFPVSTEELCALPGIGRYTAAAIASIAFDQPTAVVDGNVKRVLGRLMADHTTGEDLWRIAQQLLAQERPGDFNQAMMELGATICLPRQPRCLVCPVFDMCDARGKLPKPNPLSGQDKLKVHYALDCRNGFIFLVKRKNETSLMPGMWELPQIEGPNGAPPWLTLRHSITITDYQVAVSRVPAPQSTDGEWISRRRLAQLPLTGLARKIVRAAKLI
jgi:A/G-specific adenine glycosylase